MVSARENPSPPKNWATSVVSEKSWRRGLQAGRASRRPPTPRRRDRRRTCSTPNPRQHSSDGNSFRAFFDRAKRGNELTAGRRCPSDPRRPATGAAPSYPYSGRLLLIAHSRADTRPAGRLGSLMRSASWPVFSREAAWGLVGDGFHDATGAPSRPARWLTIRSGHSPRGFESRHHCRTFASRRSASPTSSLRRSTSSATDPPYRGGIPSVWVVAVPMMSFMRVRICNLPALNLTANEPRLSRRSA